MKSIIEQHLRHAIGQLQADGVLPQTLDVRPAIERARNAQHGHYASNIAMMLAKPASKPPRDIAAALIAAMPQNTLIDQVQIAGPGFINFTLTDEALNAVIPTIFEQQSQFGHTNIGQSKRVHIEYVSANPTGPLHVGHGRGAAYGACVSNLLHSMGYIVHREYYVNDAGRQMRILALSTWLRYLSLCGETIAFPAKIYQGTYVGDIAQQLFQQHNMTYCQRVSEIQSVLDAPSSHDTEDQHIDQMIDTMHAILGDAGFACFQTSALTEILNDIRDDLAEFGVTYDAWFHESSLIDHGKIEEGIALLNERGYVYEQDGALWFRATQFGDEKDRVLKRANQQPTYFASDVAYHLHKYQQGFDQIIDIFGADHHGYTQRIAAFLSGLGQPVDRLNILLVQFAVLYRGQQKISMSTRSGQFVTLRELRQEVGNDAARYFYIMRKPDQHLDFDLELATAQNNDNPVYTIQYAHARICSLRQAIIDKTWDTDRQLGLAHLDLLTDPQERALIVLLNHYPEHLLLAATQHEPHWIATYLQQLAHAFHRCYSATRILVDDAQYRNARLCLADATAQVLKNGLELLGLTAPTSM